MNNLLGPQFAYQSRAALDSPPPSTPSWTFIQAYSVYIATSIANVVVQANDLILVFYQVWMNPAASPCTDNASGGSNTYYQAESHSFNDGSHDCHQRIWYAKAKASETLTISTTGTDCGLSVHVVRPDSGNFALDAHNHSDEGSGGGSTSHTGASITTSQANCYIAVLWGQETASGSHTSNSPWTERTDEGAHVHCTQDYIASTVGTYAGSLATSPNNEYMNCIVAFKAI